MEVSIIHVQINFYILKNTLKNPIICQFSTKVYLINFYLFLLIFYDF